MTNAELIKGLRWCADESICCDDFSGEKCPYFDEKKDSCSVDEILHAAADALEAADKMIEDLQKQVNEFIKNETRSTVIKVMSKRIAELEAKAAFFDAEKLNYQENIEYRDERIKELEAKLTKEGEWIWDSDTGTYHCSECNETSPQEDQDGEYIDCPNYCPNCGAKMRGEHDE